nr:uncharacterized protein LOC119629473 isoform X2 [Bombyx mori]
MMTSRQVFSESEKTCLQELILKYNLHKTATMTASQNTKKLLWIHLTEEFNSIESNAKQSEAQLKKCWDNLKTRRKHFLANEKRQRMKTGGGQCIPNEPQPGSSNETLIFAEVLLDQTDVELRGVIDSDTIYSSEDIAMELESSVPAAAQPQQNDEVLSVSCARSSAEE